MPAGALVPGTDTLTINYTTDGGRHIAGTVLPAGQQQVLVTFTPTDATLYQSSSSSVSLNVNKAPLSISANNATRVYGTQNPAFSGTAGGAVNGDVFTETFSTTATSSSRGGTYPIVPSVSGANLTHYIVAATNRTLTISPAPTTTTVTHSNQNLTVTSSGTTTDNFSLAVPSGFSGTVQLSCTGLPQNANCSFQPASATVLRKHNQCKYSIDTRTGGLAHMESPSRNTNSHIVRWATVFALSGLLPLLVTARRRRLSGCLRNISPVLLLCVAGVWLTGCGGSGGGGRQTSSPATPSGHYTIQVVALGASGVSHSATVGLTVQ